MRKTIYSKLARTVQEFLIEIRKGAGLTQRQLAKKLEREHSFVARIEQGERRVDLVEFYIICKACEISPAKVVSLLYKTMAEIK